VRELAARHRWVFATLKRADAARAAAREPRPTLVLLRADPTADDPEPLRLVADLLRTRPDVAAVVLADSKLTDDDRPGWAAAVLDLGAAAVLYPPVERSVLDDLLATLMTAVVTRVVGRPPPPPADAPIDLAAGDFEADDE
jgi:DNA-binding NarL/FixJ family response regulator